MNHRRARQRGAVGFSDCAPVAVVTLLALAGIALAQGNTSSFWTSGTGAPVLSDDYSETVGQSGPVLLEDVHLIEKMALFDRERIPERVVHARGTVAKGYFEVTNDVSDLTAADFLRAPGVQTPVLVRFSTVAYGRDSPEPLRDTRGFAVKFYTRQGNYDLVGQSLPVFFLREGIKFPDLIHSIKPSPKNNLASPWRQLDFLSFYPESTHMLTWVLDDVGIPLCYRTMSGFGVHTFRLIAANGTSTYVKFQFAPSLGVQCYTDAEAATEAGKDFNCHTRDLYTSIANGTYPEWTLMIQTMKLADADTYDFDPLDPTRTWPENLFPWRTVGRMVLNQNPENHFQESEQAAFCPANVVPGIGLTDDRVLQARVFSYADASRYRLGSNYLSLPVNAPRCPFHTNYHEGVMNYEVTVNGSDVNYGPSRVSPVGTANVVVSTTPGIVSGARVYGTSSKGSDFEQAGERWRSFDPARQQRFLTRVVNNLLDPGCTKELRLIWVAYWTQADASLGAAVSAALSVAGALT